ncbi:MAG TPA: superoxide dismutase [Chloroflexia bacterium]|nr:superoxide dismutase [Chloroflexia bacterium]
MTRHRLSIVSLSALALVLAVGAFAFGLSPAQADQRPTRYILPGNTVFPEGIAFEQSTGYFYVSSTTDGTVFRGSLDEEMTEVFLPGGEDGRTTAIGLEVDGNGRLFVAGGGTGQMFVYSTETGDLIASLDNNEATTFINDVAVTRNGDAYFTDSLLPILYRVTTDDQGDLVLEEWLDFTGTPIVYETGFNLNGIEVTPNDRYLITVQSNTGKIFRIDLATQEVIEIVVPGATFASGDGLLIRGHTLYVLRNRFEELVKVQLSGDFTSGTLVSTSTHASFQFPTTLTEAHGRLLVVNSQFDRRGGEPELPFNVSSIPVP